MKTTKCVIVEDSESSVELLKAFLQKIPFCQVMAVCTNYFDAAQILLFAKDIDLVFLDIELGEELNGMDLLKTIPNIPPVIITSSHPNYAVESYTIGKAADYLLKPYQFERFLLAVNRALKMQVNYENLIYRDFIFLKKGRQYKSFDYKDILYFEAYGIYVKVITAEGTDVVNETITNLSEKLDSSWFIRVHKSFIINIQKIIGFEYANLFVQDGKVPIGISYRTQLEGLLRLLGKSGTSE